MCRIQSTLKFLQEVTSRYLKASETPGVTERVLKELIRQPCFPHETGLLHAFSNPAGIIMQAQDTLNATFIQKCCKDKGIRISERMSTSEEVAQ